MTNKKPGTKGGTGRFMACPNNPFAHTEGVGAVGIEVKWSCKRTSKGIKTSYYFGCGICKTQVFLNTWEEGWGFTLPEAEAMGLTLIDVNRAKKDALLKELGLQRAPISGVPGMPPGMPPGIPPGVPGFPHPQPGHYRPASPAPARKTKK